MVNKFYSQDYLDILQKEHLKGEWGRRGGDMFSTVHKLLTQNNITEFLDYGSGHGSLRKALDKNFPDLYTVHEYDPGITGKEGLPDPSEFVTCIDVLEHIEESYVDNVLDDLKRVTQETLLLTISTRPAVRRLKGKDYEINAHVTVKPLHWWYEKIYQRFNVLHFEGSASEIEFILKANGN